MTRLILFYLLFFLFTNYKNTSHSNDECELKNSREIECIEIIGKISNSSYFSDFGINKTIITKKQIEQSGAVDLIDILEFSPEIQITQSGPKGQQASLFMGGSGSNHTLVLINGVPINDQSSTQGLHDFGVDFIQTIDQIEIYPGSSATHFGTNAIGGAVNIILTTDYKDSLSLTTDNNKNYELAGNKTYIYDKSSLNIKIGNVKNNTISARGNLDDESDALRNYSTNINYEKYLNDNVKIQNTTYLRQTKSEYDNSNINQTGYSGDNKMGSVQFSLENKINSKLNDYILYYNFYDREYDERGTIDTYESEVIGLKYNLSDILNRNLSYGVGSEYKYEWGYFDNNGSYKASTKGNSSNLALYSNLGWKVLENSILSIFGRSEKHKQVGRNNTYKINFEQSFNDFNLGFSFMNGLRNPTLYEMFGTDNYGYSGNKNLKPEKSNTYDVYSEILINENLNLFLRAFKSNIKNNIEYISNKYQNDNDDIDLNQSGITSQLNFKIDDANLNFFTSFISSKKENGNDQLRRPNNTYGLNLSKRLRNRVIGIFNLNLKYNHYGKHFDTHSTSFNTIEMDSTDIIDLKLTKKINNNDFFIKITNLFDETYQRPHGYNQEKRIIKFGIKY